MLRIAALRSFSRTGLVMVNSRKMGIGRVGCLRRRTLWRTMRETATGELDDEYAESARPEPARRGGRPAHSVFSPGVLLRQGDARGNSGRDHPRRHRHGG